MEDLRSHLESFLPSVTGLLGIVLCDRDGVPVLKAADNKCPEHATRPAFLANYTAATDQAVKMGLGANNVLVAAYTNYQVVHVAFAPMMVTLLATSDCDTGHLISLANTLEPFVRDISKAIMD